MPPFSLQTHLGCVGSSPQPPARLLPLSGPPWVVCLPLQAASGQDELEWSLKGKGGKDGHSLSDRVQAGAAQELEVLLTGDIFRMSTIIVNL